MRFNFEFAEPLRYVCKALVVGCFEDDLEADPFLKRFDAELSGIVGELVGQKEFFGRKGTSKLIHSLGRLPAKRLLLIGMGKRTELTLDRLRLGAGMAVQILRGAGIQTYCSVLHMAGKGDAESLRATAEGTLLGGHSFDCYKTSTRDNPPVEELTFLSDGNLSREDGEKALREAGIVGEAVIFARNLVAQPANVATPSYLAIKAVEVSSRLGFDCRVLERDEMEQNGMEAILAVAKGSRQPPRFMILEYQGGDKKKRPVVLVGKGVTFDSGGISLKPREGMERMKDDMAGAAVVIGTFMAAAGLNLPINLVGLIPAAENLPGGDAYKPGDIVKTMAGKMVEIVNTDAEGRMLLCDALHFAHRYRPQVIIDIATLTGACIVALGNEATGLMGNDAGLKRELKRAGEISGERLWELPLWEEYGELMKSDVADLKNAGGPTAGTISAGWFLQQFVGGSRWAHLDIAGTAWEEKGRPYLPKGATGVGVRLLVEYLRGSVVVE